MERLRFGFLTYGLDRPLLGISRAVLELGRALQQHTACEPLFLTTYRDGPFADTKTPHAYLFGARLLPGLLSVGALQIPLSARRHALPLVHDPCGANPLWVGRRGGPYKRIVTLYDAIAFRDPTAYTWANNALHRHYIPATLSGVDAVITGTEYARQDLERFLGIAPERLHVVPCAASAAFHPVDPVRAAAVALRYGLRAPFVLYVGALERRKNVATLVRAFARLRRTVPAVTLAVVGKPRWRDDETGRTVASLAVAGSVCFTGYVPEEDLASLYSAAAVFCYPSLLEGFGLPVLEAMSCGTPVVCAAAAALPEVAAGAAWLFDPLDDEALAAALLAVLDDHEQAARLRAAGLERASAFSWQSSADQTLAVYRHVLAS